MSHDARSATMPYPMPITFPTWKKYVIMESVMRDLGIRVKRRFFALIRNTPDVSCDHYHTTVGVTIGEFSVWYYLNNTGKSKTQRRSKNTDDARSSS